MRNEKRTPSPFNGPVAKLYIVKFAFPLFFLSSFARSLVCSFAGCIFLYSLFLYHSHPFNLALAPSLSMFNGLIIQEYLHNRTYVLDRSC